MTRARAHPNIALVKYWGKQEGVANYPATPNLSITLSEFTTETVVQDREAETGTETDEIILNGNVAADDKILKFLAAMRQEFEIGPLHIETTNNFPTGAGLASSASGFAALVCALNTHCDLGMNQSLCSQWARRGSASAARSIYAGFVALLPPQWQAQQIAPPEHWPLSTVVATTSRAQKSVSSTQGMIASKQTSPFYKSWVTGSADDYADAAQAIAQRDFEQLADVAEHSCLKMHSVMLSTQPALMYWNAATMACMHAVRELRSTGHSVFFTIDAGPQVKAICLQEDAESVAHTLRDVPGVEAIDICGMGDGATIIDNSTHA